MRVIGFKSCILNCFFLLLFSFFASIVFAQDASSGSEILAQAEKPVSSVCWSPDGKRFASSWNNSVIIWDAEMNTIVGVFSGHNEPVISSSFSKDGKWFLSLAEDNSLIIRNIADQEQSIKLKGNKNAKIRDAVFVDNGFTVMLPYDGVNVSEFYRLIYTKSFTISQRFKSEKATVALDTNYDNSQMLMYSTDGTVSIADLATKEIVETFKKAEGSTIKPRFSPDGRCFVATEDKNTLSITLITSAKERESTLSQNKISDGESIETVSFDGDGNAENDTETITEDTVPQLQKTEQTAENLELTTKPILIKDRAEFINTAAFSPDGRIIAAALSDGSVKLYNIATKKLVKAYSVALTHKDVVNSIDFSPDGNFLIAGTEKGYIIRWNLNQRVFVPIKKQYNDEDIIAIASIYDMRIDIPTVSTDSSNGEGDGIVNSNTLFAIDSDVLAVEDPVAPDIPVHQIPLGLGYASVPSEYYLGSVFMTANYQNFANYPFYFGGGINLTASVPNNNFPFEYYYADIKISAPWLYHFAGEATGGISFYFVEPRILCYADLCIGIIGKVLCNNTIGALYVSKPNVSVYGKIDVGMQWQGFRLNGGLQYDITAGPTFSFSVGYVFGIKSKAQKENEAFNEGSF